MLHLAGLVARRETGLAGNARAVLLPDAFVLAAAPDPDGDPWVLAHGIWHRQFDLSGGAYVCVEAATIPETAADLFAGYLLIGEVPTRHGHGDADLAAAIGVTVGRIQAWRAQLAAPHRGVIPTEVLAQEAEQVERSDGCAR